MTDLEDLERKMKVAKEGTTRDGTEQFDLCLALIDAAPEMISELKSLRAMVEEFKKMDVEIEHRKNENGTGFIKHSDYALMCKWRTLRDGLVKKYGV